MLSPQFETKNFKLWPAGFFDQRYPLNQSSNDLECLVEIISKGRKILRVLLLFGHGQVCLARSELATICKRCFLIMSVVQLD